jgi:uncharacterized phage infection (PIP) family protein YhgE
MNHAGGGMYGTGQAANKIADEAAEAKNAVSHAHTWIQTMDDSSLKYYLHRETKRVNELHHALEVAEDFLKGLEKVAEERGIDLFG